MWDFLDPSFRHYLNPHKKSTLIWKELDNDTKTLQINYDSINEINSSGFRAEIYLEPNTTYILEIEAKLNIGDFAFVYAESNKERLIPRFKIYKNEQSYQLNYNFVTPTDTKDSIQVFIGISQVITCY